MDNFKKEFTKAKRTLGQFYRVWNKLENCIEYNDENGAYDCSLETERIAERLIFQLRNLATYSGDKEACEAVVKNIQETALVEVGYTKEGWFRLSIPALLPRKEKDNPEYVRSLIYPAMSDFFTGKQVEKFKDCTLVYLHTYDVNRPKREWRDHDNVEVNAVTDIVALFVMLDDSPHICEHYYASKSGTENRTEVFVLPKRDLEKFRTQKGLYDSR